MGQETERKFLLKGEIPQTGTSHSIWQGYLNRAKERTVRVRIMDDKAQLTIKGPAVGGTNPEFEYDIPPEHARVMLAQMCEGAVIEKTRHTIKHGGLTWEVDVFEGENEGLAFAEIELERPDQAFDLPDWVGEEVTGDPRYFNSRLSETPFREWNEAYRVTIYFAPTAKTQGQSLARALAEQEFRVRADNWLDAREPGDGPLTRFAETNPLHFHPTAGAKAVAIRDKLARGFALKEGDVVVPGSRWVIGPRAIYVLMVE